MTARRAAPPKRRQRQHGVLPAGFVWRDGRPRWLPSPTRRAQGWKPTDLAARTARGEKNWLSRGDAITRAEAINAAVAAWTLKGAPVPANMADFAPPGSTDGGALSPSEKLDRRSIGAMIDAWLATPRFTLERGQGGLSPKTISDYRSKMTRLQHALVESDDPTKIKALRALPIDTLAAPVDEDDAFPLEDAYHWLIQNAGHDMAYGALSVASAWLTWCHKKKRILSLSANPVALIDRTPPQGRIRVGTKPEMAALVAAASELGLASIGDAVLMALDLGWSLQDILRLDRSRVVRLPHPETGVPRWVVSRNVRGKTGVIGSDIPLLTIGTACVERIIARHAGAKVTPTHLIVREPSPRNRSGQWTPRAFNEAWQLVRNKAAETAPTLLTGDGQPGSPFDTAFDFMDTRDTFITLARQAKLSVEGTCSRSQHKNTSRVLAVWQKYYGAITPEIANEGADQMDAYMAVSGWAKALTKGV